MQTRPRTGAVVLPAGLLEPGKTYTLAQLESLGPLPPGTQAYTTDAGPVYSDGINLVVLAGGDVAITDPLNPEGALRVAPEDANGDPWETAGLGPQTSANSVSVTNPSDSGGGFSGITASANFTPAAAAYLGGDLISVAQEFSFTFANGVAVPTGSLIRILTAIVKIDQTAIISGETSYSLALYSLTPPSAQADNAAWTLASGDLSAYRGTISLGTPVDLGAACYVKTPNVDIDVKLAATSLFGQLLTGGSFTATAVARQILLYGVVL